jgi:hypothetical protein
LHQIKNFIFLSLSTFRLSLPLPFFNLLKIQFSMAFFTSFSLSMFHLHVSLLFHLPFSFSSSNFQICTADIEEGDSGEDGDGEIGCAGARKTRERRR